MPDEPTIAEWMPSWTQVRGTWAKLDELKKDLYGDLFEQWIPDQETGIAAIDQKWDEAFQYCGDLVARRVARSSKRDWEDVVNKSDFHQAIVFYFLFHVMQQIKTEEYLKLSHEYNKRYDNEISAIVPRFSDNLNVAPAQKMIWMHW